MKVTIQAACNCGECHQPLLVMGYPHSHLMTCVNTLCKNYQFAFTLPEVEVKQVYPSQQ